MTESEWHTSADARALYRALPVPVSDRRVRLWGAACGRVMVAPTSPTPRYDAFRTWLADPAWAAVIAAAEDYADGRIDRGELRARRVARDGSGGPYNVFRALAAATEFTQDRVLGTILGGYANEFGVPTAEESADRFRDIFANSFRPVAFDPTWRTEAVVGLARGMYESRDFAPISVLADALQDAGCADADVIAHCRGPGPHVRGCWVVDLVLGKS